MTGQEYTDLLRLSKEDLVLRLSKAERLNRELQQNNANQLNYIKRLQQTIENQSAYIEELLLQIDAVNMQEEVF